MAGRISLRLQRQRSKVGRVIRAMREDLPVPLSQEQLVGRLNELTEPAESTTGAVWTKQAVSKIEAGARRLDVAELVEIAKAMQVDPHLILARYLHELAAPDEPPALFTSKDKRSAR